VAGSTIYHFEREIREGEWSAVGSGEGGGEGSPQRALEDLRRLSGGELPPGRYRYLLAFDPTDQRWGYLVLAEDGSIARL
jgi:hypothetical protein